MARESHLNACFWLFAAKCWEVAGNCELSFCSNSNAASVVLTMLSDGDTQTLLDGKNANFKALIGGGDTKTFQFP